MLRGQTEQQYLFRSRRESGTPWLQWDKSLTLTDQRRRRTMASPGARSEIARDRDSRDPSQSLSYLKLRVSKLMAQYYRWEMDLSDARLVPQRHQLPAIWSNWLELCRCDSKLSHAPPMMDWWMSVVSIRGNNGHSLVTATARIHHNQLWYKLKLRMGKLNFNSDRGAVTDVSIKSDWLTDTRLTSPHPPPSLSFLSRVWQKWTVCSWIILGLWSHWQQSSVPGLCS